MPTHTATTGYDRYRQTHVEASLGHASPLQMVIMLTDGLLDEFERLRGHIANRRFEAKAQSISRCLAILVGLECALDEEAQSEPVRQVAELYQYCRALVGQAGVELSTVPLDRARMLMTALRDAWRSALKEGR
ncbi:flagellar export chaperone FliS [Chitinasiproducens palmae]|uniref:Flagellar secretion chaperone FliS n=1 Tax=Chitinasiproducens palmae TaxID=1770053 RepID=A0A1H2PKF4_9BURK|nr:flagellar export chaperone FliS [Chitinasiproducens palmae]SDV46939.1 flagellar protein FliS [Chitinasiproducens palmae]